MNRLLLLFLSTVACLGAADVQFDFRNSALESQKVKSLQWVPIYVYDVTNNVLVTRDRLMRTTATDGTLTISNVLQGLYRSEFAGATTTTTNWFQIPNTNGTINAWLFKTNNTFGGFPSNAMFATYATLLSTSNALQVQIQTATVPAGLVTNGGSALLTGSNYLGSYVRVDGDISARQLYGTHGIFGHLYGSADAADAATIAYGLDSITTSNLHGYTDTAVLNSSNALVSLVASNTAGVASWEGQVGNVVLDKTNIIQRLGYTPQPSNSTLTAWSSQPPTSATVTGTFTGTLSGNASTSSYATNSGSASSALTAANASAVSSGISNAWRRDISSGFPTVTVSSRGIANGLSTTTNNGKMYGPDTPGTMTSGLQEAFNSMPHLTVMGPAATGINLQLESGYYYFTNKLWFSNDYPYALKITGSTLLDTKLVYAGNEVGVDCVTICGSASSLAASYDVIGHIVIRDVGFSCIANVTNTLLWITNQAYAEIESCQFTGWRLMTNQVWGAGVSITESIPIPFANVGLKISGGGDHATWIRHCFFSGLATGADLMCDHAYVDGFKTAEISPSTNPWPNTSPYSLGAAILRRGGLDGYYRDCHFYGVKSGLLLIGVTRGNEVIEKFMEETCDYALGSSTVLPGTLLVRQPYLEGAAEQYFINTTPTYSLTKLDKAESFCRFEAFDDSYTGKVSCTPVARTNVIFAMGFTNVHDLDSNSIPIVGLKDRAFVWSSTSHSYTNPNGYGVVFYSGYNAWVLTNASHPESDYIAGGSAFVSPFQTGLDVHPSDYRWDDNGSTPDFNYFAYQTNYVATDPRVFLTLPTQFTTNDAETAIVMLGLRGTNSSAYASLATNALNALNATNLNLVGYTTNGNKVSWNDGTDSYWQWLSNGDIWKATPTGGLFSNNVEVVGGGTSQTEWPYTAITNSPWLTNAESVTVWTNLQGAQLGNVRIVEGDGIVFSGGYGISEGGTAVLNLSGSTNLPASSIVGTVDSATNLTGNINISQVVSPGAVLTQAMTVLISGGAGIGGTNILHNRIISTNSAKANTFLDLNGATDGGNVIDWKTNNSSLFTVSGNGNLNAPIVYAGANSSGAFLDGYRVALYNAWGFSGRAGFPGWVALSDGIYNTNFNGLIMGPIVSSAASFSNTTNYPCLAVSATGARPGFRIQSGTNSAAASDLTVNGTLTCSNLVANAAFDLMPVGSTTTNSGAVRFWNSNNAAIYVRGTNGVDKLITSWP